MGRMHNSVNVRSFPRSNMLYNLSTTSNEQGSQHRHRDIVKNKQGFPHLHERVWVKKFIHSYMEYRYSYMGIYGNSGYYDYEE